MADEAVSQVNNFDRWYADNRRERYTFQWANQQWSLPNFAEIDLRVIGVAVDLDALADGDEDAEVSPDLVLKLFEYGFAFDAEQAERWKNTPQPIPVMLHIFAEWQQHGSSDLGELSASTASSRSTGRPSKLTSRATTKGSGSRARSTGGRKRG